MVRREEQQISLADALVYERVSGNQVLTQIEEHVDWKPLRLRLEKLYRTEGAGRPAFPVITMFKVLLLQNLYHLSDPAAEEAISDRLSFRRFLGLNLDQPVPDHTTIHRFRDRIAGHADELLALLNQQLEALHSSHFVARISAEKRHLGGRYAGPVVIAPAGIGVHFQL
jgi:transposase